MNSVIFVAGVYGVGKSTLCNKLSSVTGIPAFSAGDLISDINGETYGRNKVVKDAKSNQDILISAVDAKLEKCPHFLLAGHFCIVDKENEVELLPEYVFSKLHCICERERSFGYSLWLKRHIFLGRTLASIKTGKQHDAF